MNVLPFFFILALALLAVEIAWRVRKYLQTGSLVWAHPQEGPDKPLLFRAHPYCLYEKRPNSRGLYPSNSLGYAGVREYSVQKPAGVVRLLVLGGSTAEDHAPEAGPNSSWPAQLEDLLRQRLGTDHIEVINAGLSGYSSAESLSDFMLRGIELQPDILLIYHNVNDALTIQMADGFRPDYAHVRQAKSWEPPLIHRLPRIRFLLSYEYLRFLLIQEFGMARTVLERISSPPWASSEPFDPDRVRVFKRNTAHMAALARTACCQPVLIKWECPWETRGRYPWPQVLLGDPAELGRKYFRYIEANNEALRELGGELGVPYIEVGPFERALFRPDNLHFTLDGLTLMARRVADAIEPQVRQLVERARREAP